MYELLGVLLPGARVLDMGCGNGSFPYSDYPALQITALDLQEPTAASGWPANAAFQRGVAEVLPFPDESFDLVIGNFVFEHTTDFARAIAEAGRVLFFGSWLYLSVPNARSF